MPDTLTQVIDTCLMVPFLLVLAGAVVLTVVSRGIQVRALPLMGRLLLQRATPETPAGQVDGRKALFTAMSTTIGIGNIVGPIVAMGFGGPGALMCYVLASFFGAAATYSEVFLALRHRYERVDGALQGGPMTYLRACISPNVANLYAACGCVLLMGWSTNQSNTLGTLLAPYGVPAALTGAVMAVAVLAVLWGGIERVAKINERMVPFMFVLYTTACVWILMMHARALPGAVTLVVSSFWQPRAWLGGVAVHGGVEVLRWGLARAVQANEAGVGTATIAHAASSGTTPTQQGVLAMASVYSNGFLCVLTGLVVLVSGAYARPDAVFDITLLAGIFEAHFPVAGALPLGVSAFLFAFGTIIGNCYNGGQCFAYLSRHGTAYQLLCALAVFAGALGGLRFVWSLVDFLILPVVVPHIAAVVVLALRKEVRFNLHQNAHERPPGPRRRQEGACVATRHGRLDPGGGGELLTEAHRSRPARR